MVIVTTYRGWFGLSDEISKTKTRNKWIFLPSRNIPQTKSGGNKDVITRCYPYEKQYLSLPKTSEGRRYLRAFMRRIAGMGRWQIIEKDAIFLINSILKYRKRNIKGIRDFSKNNFALKIIVAI